MFPYKCHQLEFHWNLLTWRKLHFWPAYENRIYLQVNLNEPCTDSRSGKLLRTAGWSYVDRLSSIHVCILLESCTGNSLCKYLDSQMMWFELTKAVTNVLIAKKSVSSLYLETEDFILKMSHEILIFQRNKDLTTKYQSYSVCKRIKPISEKKLM